MSDEIIIERLEKAIRDHKKETELMWENSGIYEISLQAVNEKLWRILKTNQQENNHGR